VRERWSTIAAVALTVIGLSGFGIVWAIRTGDPRWMFLSLPFALAIFVMARFAPTGYRLGPEGIRVERRTGGVTIPYRKIRGVDQVARPVAGLSMWGSQGVFGRFGLFWNMRLGLYRLYLANREHVVWLATEDGWVGLSPDRPDEFVRQLESHR
jgi:hypothetical protein